MKPSIKQIDKDSILYDDDCAGKVSVDWFEPEYWQAQQAVIGEALGRGTAWFLRQENSEWVLRHYRRGGLVAKLLGDRYLWTGLEQTRAWREWLLLEAMSQAGLPVPQPLATRVRRQGLFYTADLLTVKIPATQSLTHCLEQGSLDKTSWQNIGQTIARFHQVGIYHADLNANNILLDEQQRVFIIDFDRGEKRSSGAWEKANLDRLLRSLHKQQGLAGGQFHFSDSDWQALNAAYQQAL